MKNIIKSTAYSAVALASVATTFAAPNYGQNDTAAKFGDGKSVNIKTTLENILTYVLSFLSLIAVAFAIYGGFQILTAGWDEDKVKKGKTTLINALIWVFVIMIAWTLVGWIFSWGQTIANNGKIWA